jgi:uncharacterized protein with HEPN domain
MLQEGIEKSNEEAQSDIEQQKVHLLQILSKMEEIEKYSNGFHEIKYFSNMIRLAAEEKLLFFSHNYN